MDFVFVLYGSFHFFALVAIGITRIAEIIAAFFGP